MGRNLTNLPISASFQYLTQISGSELTDGLGADIDSLNISASYATNAGAADTATSASHAIIADSALSALTATSASHAVNADSALTADSATTATSASHAVNSDSAISSSYAVTASYAENVEPINTGSFYVSSSITDAQITFTQGDGSTEVVEVNNVSSSISASHAVIADSALTSTSASYALTASYAENAFTPTLQQVLDAGDTANNANIILNAGGLSGADKIIAPNIINQYVAGASTIFRLSGSVYSDITIDERGTVDAGFDIRTTPNGAYDGVIAFTSGSQDGTSTTDLLVINPTQNLITSNLPISASSYISASEFIGDGSQLTNLPATDPFPYTGSADVSGSVVVNGLLQSGNSNNSATGTNTAVIGGNNNTANGDKSVVIGGQNNVANNTCYVFGGENHLANGANATVVGGTDNDISNGSIDSIFGGWGNDIFGGGVFNQTIVAGNSNIIQGAGGVTRNVLSLGGQSNTMRGNISRGVIIGGFTNKAGQNSGNNGAAESAIIIGGRYNHIGETTSTAGYNADFSMILNSSGSEVDSGSFQNVIGGNLHYMSGSTNSTIIGGESAIMTGADNSIALGLKNQHVSGSDMVYIGNNIRMFGNRLDISGDNIGGAGSGFIIGNGNDIGNLSIVVGKNNTIGFLANGFSPNYIFGQGNTITGNATRNNILIGTSNTFNQNGVHNVLIGNSHQASTTVNYAGAFAGDNSTISHDYSVVLGGSNLSTSKSNEVVVPNLRASGSVEISGSTDILGVLSLPGISDVSASIAAAGGGGAAFPYTGSAEISGSLEVAGKGLTVNSTTGTANSVTSNDEAGNFILGGYQNTITGNNGFDLSNGIAASYNSDITSNGYDNFIAGANSSTISGTCQDSAIIGSNSSTISAIGFDVILGGSGNNISGGADRSAIIGGDSNSVTHDRSVVVGGTSLSTTKNNEVVVPNLTTNGTVVQNVEAISIISNTGSLDASLGNMFTITLQNGVDTHLELSNQSAGQTFSLKITNNATAAGTISFDTQFEFEGGTPFTATAATNAVDILTFTTFDGSNVQCVGSKNFS